MSSKKSSKKDISNAYLISQYFGFNYLNIPGISKEDKEQAEKIKNRTCGTECEDLPVTAEPISLMRKLLKERKFKEEEELDPSMVYCEGYSKGCDRKLKNGEKVINLHIIGTPKSIAEAILIKTAITILKEEGYKNLNLEINNIGGKEAYSSFLKDLNAYYRKQINNMDSDCRQLFKESVHGLVSKGKTLDEEVRLSAPSPFNYLTDENRDHLKEVIEFLDESNIDYGINKDILGNPNYSTNTVFTIKDRKNGQILATGSRYNQLAKKTIYRKGIPAIGMSIKLPTAKTIPSSNKIDLKKVRFYFIQIGFHAKLKSLQILDNLKNSKIPVFTSLSQDKLSSQISNAKKRNVPYLIILGQKEAMNGTIVVRDTKTHSQTILNQKELVSYLKALP